MACTRVSSRTLSFPCFLLVSLQHPLVSSGNPGETPWNSSFWGGSEPCLRLFWGQNRQNTGYFAGIPGKPRYTWKIPGYRADFLNFAPDFAPDQLSDSGKLASFPRETREKQNGAPNTLWFPWKLPETQSAGDPLVSLWRLGCRKLSYRPTQDRPRPPCAVGPKSFPTVCFVCNRVFPALLLVSALSTSLHPPDSHGSYR